MADTLIQTRPTNGVSYGYTHTIDSDDAVNKGIIFDFQVGYSLAAIIEYLSSTGVVTSLAGASITYPAVGQIKISDYALEILRTTAIEIASKYSAHIADAAEHSVADTDNVLTTTITESSTLSEVLAFISQFMLKYNSHDDDVDGVVSDLSTAIRRANTLKSTIIAHISDAVEHTSADTELAALLTAVPNATDLTSLLTLTNALTGYYSDHDDDVDGAVSRLISAIDRANILKSTLVTHMADTTEHVLADTIGTTLSAVPDATDLTSLVTLTNALTEAYANHDDDVDGVVTHLNAAIMRANTIKAILVSHMADTVEHLLADPAGVTLAAIPDATDLTSLITLVTGLITAYVAHDDDVDEVTPIYHQATSSKNDLASAVAPTDLTESCTRLEDIEAKYNLHDADSTSHTTGSTHQATVLVVHQAVSSQNNLTSEAAVTDLATSSARLEDIKAKFNLHDADSTSHTTGGVYAVSLTIYHQAVSSQNDLAALTTVVDLAGAATRLEDIETKYNLHDADSTSHTTGGTHSAGVEVYHVGISTENQIADTTAPTTVTEAIVDVNSILTAFTAHDADSTSHTTGSTHAPTSSTVTATEFVFTVGSKLKVVAQRSR